MTTIDPNAPASPDSGIFGLPFTEQDARLVLLPVPWEATTSYGGGTVNGPAALLRASHQLDLCDRELEKPYEAGICLLEENQQIRALNEEARGLAAQIIEAGGVISNQKLAMALSRVNELSGQLNTFVRDEARRILKSGKILGLVGGDHSTPFGAIQAVAEQEKDFGILHIDAHFDLRKAFEGFEFSHASIFYNVLDKIPEVKRLVSVGIRDFCEEELAYLKSQNGRAQVFFDAELAELVLEGKAWSAVCKQIISALPDKVWISFDIDGLDPSLCSLTGTPVPGGLSFSQIGILLRLLTQSGKKILGFDLCEVGAPENFPENSNEWDANVGMRVLYKLCGWTLASQGLVERKK